MKIINYNIILKLFLLFILLIKIKAEEQSQQNIEQLNDKQQEIKQVKQEENIQKSIQNDIESQQQDYINFLEIQQQSKEKSKEDSQTINGKIKINGILYKTICECGDSPSSSSQQQKNQNCDPSKFKISQNKVGKQGLSFEQIRELVGHPKELSYINVADQHFSCLDGRINGGVLGTPGGDAGEFILALHVYENYIGRAMSEDQVKDSFQAYLNWMRPEKFYMCIDDVALDHLEKDMGLSITIETLKNPKPANQKDLINYLIKPDNNGDIHLKRLLKQPQHYAIRRQLVQSFIKAFYQTLWDKSNKLRNKIILENLLGDHEEQAFLEIRSNEACKTAMIAPLIKPKLKKDTSNIVQSFVNHLDAASIRRRQLASFFINQYNKQQDNINIDILHNRMNKQGIMFLEVTGSYLARSLHFYTLSLV